MSAKPLLFLLILFPSILKGQYDGGLGSGHDSFFINSKVLNGTDPSFLFSGGNGDGSDSFTIVNLLLDNSDPSFLFSGGDADGSYQLKIEQLFLNNGDPSILFAGGDADGFGQLASPFRLLDGISPTFVFSGGDGDGYSDLGESFGTLNGTHRPGSGTAISFNGTDQYVNIGDDTNLDLDNGTIEFWFKPDWTPGSLGYTPVVVSKWTSVGLLRRYSIAVEDDMSAIGLRNGSSYGTVAYTFNQGEWYHVAFREDGSDTRVFVNGVGQGFTGNVFNTDTGAPFNIGSNNGLNPFPGEIDEVRVWSAVLTLPELRGWMSKKVTSNHPQYANLEGYWRFDEGNESATKNWVGGNDGALMNSPTWTASGAMIGDESTYDFTSPTSLSLNVTNARQLTVDITGGTVDGIQIYYVDESPSDVTPPTGFNNVDSKYFGVFITGTNPVYTMTYDYSGNTAVNDENNIQIASRTNNADTWADLNGTVDTNANTITQTGLTGTEFILGGTVYAALPVTLLSFTADVTGPNEVLLYWRTATEINNDYFQLERSGDASNFEPIGKIIGSGNTTEVKEYQFSDRQAKTGINYYRFTQFDFDGSSDTSKVIVVEIKPRINSISIYPNPVKTQLHVSFHNSVSENLIFDLIDLRGKKYKLEPKFQQGLEYVFQLKNLQSGVYTLAINMVNEVVYHKLLLVSSADN